MLLFAVSLGLATFSAFATAKRWNRSLAWTASRRRVVFDRWSEQAWLGWVAGDALTPVWFLAVAVMAVGEGALFTTALVVLVVATLGQATLFLFGFPALLMPPALRGVFRGWLRTAAARSSAE